MKKIFFAIVMVLAYSFGYAQNQKGNSNGANNFIGTWHCISSDETITISSNGDSYLLSKDGNMLKMNYQDDMLKNADPAFGKVAYNSMNGHIFWQKKEFEFVATAPAAPSNVPVQTADNNTESSNTEIHWITSFDELQAKMRQNPKKVYMDVYTGWCGWCKKMDATTFQNPALIKYINDNYYAVRFDAERKDDIQFQGKEYNYEAQYKANALAAELLKGKLSYPTSVIMLENFQNPQPIAGYMDVKQLETVLTYIGDNAIKTQTWDAYQKSYRPTWEQDASTDVSGPPRVSPDSPR